MEIVRRVVRAVRTVVVVVVGLYLFLNSFAVLAGFVESHVVARDVTAVLERVGPSAIESQDELADSAARPPDRRWIEQSCEFRSDDSGWVAINHRETCVLRSISAWHVGSEAEARGLVPLREDGGWSFDGCVDLGPVGDLGVVESPRATYVDRAALTGRTCPPADTAVAESRGLAGDRQPITSGTWLVVSAEQPLVDEDIGCVRWSLVFCDNPWVRHAWGDWPSSP